MTDGDWFTIESIDTDTFAISEYRHWERPHSYLLRSRAGAVLIDSGLGVADISAVVRGLTDDPVTVVTTHVHWDHVGGHDRFDKVGVHPNEADWLRHGIPVPDDTLRGALLKEPFDAPEGFDPAKWLPPRVKPTCLITDGDEISIGARRIKALHTPGHSPGHLCFYEQDRGFLFTGDLLYRGTLYADFPSTDPVAYERSIRSLTSLDDVTMVLPGHNETPLDSSWLGAAAELFVHLKRSDLLHHGAGMHAKAGLSIRL